MKKQIKRTNLFKFRETNSTIKLAQKGVTKIYKVHIKSHTNFSFFCLNFILGIFKIIVHSSPRFWGWAKFKPFYVSGSGEFYPYQICTVNFYPLISLSQLKFTASVRNAPKSIIKECGRALSNTYKLGQVSGRFTLHFRYWFLK